MYDYDFQVISAVPETVTRLHFVNDENSTMYTVKNGTERNKTAIIKKFGIKYACYLKIIKS